MLQVKDRQSVRHYNEQLTWTPEENGHHWILAQNIKIFLAYMDALSLRQMSRNT